MQNLEKNLLSELRLAVIGNEEKELNDEGMVKAITINDELKNLGYTLKPIDIVKLAKIEHPEKVLEDVVEAYDHEDFKPMYPDFPNQVLNMDEATYRFHQLVHYFSTYGIENLFGVEVTNGWMPNVEETEKTKEDKSLVDLNVIELKTKEEAFEKVKGSIINKKERWTDPEINIVREVAKENKDIVKEIPFKENLRTLYKELGDENFSKEDKKEIIKNNCQHAGDVLKLADDILRDKRRFKTSEKRFFVQLLESYPVNNFRENLGLSRDRYVVLMKELSYSRFSKSEEHLDAVKDLREDKIRTFNSMLEEKLQNKTSDALEFYATRPGEMIRNCSRLLRTGYSKEEIFNVLKDKKDSFKTQTLLSNTTKLTNPLYDMSSGSKISGRSTKLSEEECKNVAWINRALLKEQMKTWDTPLKDKSIAIDEGRFDFSHSTISTNDKAAEGGYIPGGVATKINSDAEVVRLFSFWDNKKERVDLDLHAHCYTDTGYLHVGWNGEYNKEGVYMSGDITTSNNSAEFIDIRTDSPLKYAALELHSFTRQNFSDIDKCFIGIMPVKELGEKVKQYNPKNLIYHHDLRETKNLNDIQYGVYAKEDNYMRILDKDENCAMFRLNKEGSYTLKDFIQDLCEAQKCKIEPEKEFADVIVRLDKGQSEKELSLIDHNFFMPGGNLDKKEEKEQTIIKEGRTQ